MEEIWNFLHKQNYLRIKTIFGHKIYSIVCKVLPHDNEVQLEFPVWADQTHYEPVSFITVLALKATKLRELALFVFHGLPSI